jgi:hypothetical protein
MRSWCDELLHGIKAGRPSAVPRAPFGRNNHLKPAPEAVPRRRWHVR